MHDKPNRKRQLLTRNQIFIVLGAILVLVLAGNALKMVDAGEIKYDDQIKSKEREAITEIVDIGGVSCIPKKNIRTYLFMGIDDTAEIGENYVMGGQCDVLMLLVVDQTHMTYQRLPINRNTMCEVRSYDMDWEDLGTDICQIALAHAKGDGGTRSCENAVEAVSTYLYGIKVDNYIALDIDAIPVINRLAGGVTVKIEDDFSDSDPSLKIGETIKLSDEQAKHYLRGRMTVGDGTNEGRMRRQETYLNAMREQVTEKARNDASYASEVYKTLEPYMVTDLNGKSFSRLVNALLECESRDTVTITGEVGEDEFGFATFEPDKTSVRDAVIELFYHREEA